MNTTEKLLIGFVGVVFVVGAAVAVAKPGDLGDDESAGPQTTTTTVAEPPTTTGAPATTTPTLPDGADEGTTDTGTTDTGTDSTPTSETPTSETPTSETPTSETPTSETPSTETPSTETPTTTGSDSGVGSTTDGNVGTEDGTADTGMESMAGPGLVLLAAALGLSRLARRRQA